MRHFAALFIAIHLLGSVVMDAQDAPTITISKGDRISVAVNPLGGAEGVGATKVLQNDLALAGYFAPASAATASFVIAGSASGGALEGKVTDQSGKTVLSKSYNGSDRGKVHAFANDIVQTLTGNRGIATTRIAFIATASGKKEVYTADYDGANRQQLTRDNGISVAPSLSPDGSRLVYTGYQSGYPDVYEIDLSSGARNRIIKFPGTNSGAAFAPDGRRIAVTCSKDGNPELYVTAAGGTGARRLTRTPGVESSPTWNPDGSEIIYSSDERGGPQLFRISSGGGSGRMLATGRSYCTEPSWSPDGKKVAFNVREGGEFQIAVLELGGGGTRVLNTGGDAQDPVWGADSRHILFAQGSSLNLLDAQTGKKTTVVSGLGRISEPAWSR